MFKLKGPEVTISETVFLNTHWWGWIIALVLNALFYIPMIWVEREFTVSGVLGRYLFTHFFMIVLLQLLYMCGKCKFLERMPRKRGYRRQHQANA